MQYGDEENISLRQESVHNAKLDIYGLAELNGTVLTFSRRGLFEDKVSMLLPEQFDVMSYEKARFKYTSEFRPHLIITDESGTINFTFSYLEDETASNETIVKMQDDLRMSSKIMHPANILDDIQQINTTDLLIPWYTSRATAFDADIFLVQFLVAIDSKLLMGGFNCVYGEHEDWLVLLPQCLATIMDETINQKAEG